MQKAPQPTPHLQCRNRNLNWISMLARIDATSVVIGCIMHSYTARQKMSPVHPAEQKYLQMKNVVVFMMSLDVIQVCSIQVIGAGPSLTCLSSISTITQRLSSRYFSRSFFTCFLNLVTFTLVHFSRVSLIIIAFHLVFVLSLCYSTHDSYEFL